MQFIVIFINYLCIFTYIMHHRIPCKSLISCLLNEFLRIIRLMWNLFITLSKINSIILQPFTVIIASKLSNTHAHTCTHSHAHTHRSTIWKLSKLFNLNTKPQHKPRSPTSAAASSNNINQQRREGATQKRTPTRTHNNNKSSGGSSGNKSANTAK